jgi:hypothetical protein
LLANYIWVSLTHNFQTFAYKIDSIECVANAYSQRLLTSFKLKAI